jgi:hypothetical protein
MSAARAFAGSALPLWSQAAQSLMRLQIPFLTENRIIVSFSQAEDSDWHLRCRVVRVGRQPGGLFLIKIHQFSLWEPVFFDS